MSHEQQGIHRHQTPPRYRNAANLPRIAIHPTTTERDVIHKTGSTQHIETPPEEDRATATGDLLFLEDRSSGSNDMLADRQTHRQTDKLITILRSPTGAE